MADQQLVDLRLNDQQWEVSDDAHRALVEGRKYRVYYLPRSLNFVAIEPID